MTVRIIAGPDAGPYASLLGAIHAESLTTGWSADDIGRLLALPGAFVAVASEDVPCGFALARTAADEAEIVTLAVVPGRRRRGIGRALVEGVLAEARRRDCRSVFLEVAADNEAARRLYQGCAFREVGRRPHYYSRPSGPAVDAAIMRRDACE
jgi:ribosomal-protein-alanine N-acetyltransferase